MIKTIALQQEASRLSLRLLQEDLTDFVRLFASVGRRTDRFDISISLNVLLISAELVNSKHEVVMGIIDLLVRYLPAGTLWQQMCRESVLASG